MMTNGDGISGPGRLDVHVHVEQLAELAFFAGLHQGEVRVAGKGAPGRSRWVWSVKMLGIVGLVGLAVAVGYRAGASPHPQFAGDPLAPSVGAAMARDLAPASEQMPPALARELATPPEVTPAPGGPSRPHAPTGPAAFGLEE